MQIPIISWICALLKSDLFITHLMSLPVNLNDASDLWVRGVKTEGIVLLFCMNGESDSWVRGVKKSWSYSTSILCQWTLLRKMFIEKFVFFL